MRKGIVLIAILLILAAIGGVVYYINMNTPIFGVGVNKENIIKNNQNVDIEEGDLTTLNPQILKVPEQYQEGEFEFKRTLYLPKDFEISVYVSGLSAPRLFTFDGDDNIIVADKGAGALYMLKDDDKDGIVDKTLTIDKELQNVNSVKFYKGDLYVAEEHQVVAYTMLDPDASYEEKIILIEDLPVGGNHVTRTIEIGPDEKIYLSIGSSCNVCEEKDERRATVMRFNIDGSDGRIYASGLRNSVGMEFWKGELWSVDNGRDMIGDDAPSEEVNVLEENGNYGWPYCYGQGTNNPEYRDKEEYCKTETIFPKYEMQAHSAPLGIGFLPDSNKVFPEDLIKNIFIGFHGSWNRTDPTGYKVVRIDTGKDDSPVVNFITGWLQADGKACGRPVDVGFDSKGIMYISDDEAGAIYRVAYGEENWVDLNKDAELSKNKNLIKPKEEPSVFSFN